jgi:hypothetical protein
MKALIQILRVTICLALSLVGAYAVTAGVCLTIEGMSRSPSAGNACGPS